MYFCGFLLRLCFGLRLSRELSTPTAIILSLKTFSRQSVTMTQITKRCLCLSKHCKKSRCHKRRLSNSAYSFNKPHVLRSPRQFLVPPLKNLPLREIWVKWVRRYTTLQYQSANSPITQRHYRISDVHFLLPKFSTMSC